MDNFLIYTVIVKKIFKILSYFCFGKTTRRLLTKGCQLESNVFKSSHFCQPLFEGNFTIGPNTGGSDETQIAGGV